MTIGWKTALALIVAAMNMAWLELTVAAEDEYACLPSDIFIENARIYTADDGQWTADALAVRGDRIVFVGNGKEVNQRRCGAARVIDLDGATVFPGFTDSHQHLEGVGRRTRTLSLFGIATLAGTISAIEQWSEQVEVGDWVLGRG